MSADFAIVAQGIEHRYGDRQAVAGVDFDVPVGGVLGLLGPNGGGKTTLFRILSTLLPLQTGEVRIFGKDLRREPAAVRATIGVTFQSPSLDRKLTVGENLRYHGQLYGLSGRDLNHRITALVARLGVTDRRADRVESLSGGLQRRVEIAKGMLHDPRILLLDEPSTGLDPGARHELWRHLLELRNETGVTILVTTHLMEEADHCDRLGILDSGKLVAWGTPDELRRSVGGDSLTIRSDDPARLSGRIREKFGIEPQMLGDSLRIEHAQAHELLRDLVAVFPAEITSVTFGKPTLEDVFINRTGHRFWEAPSP